MTIQMLSLNNIVKLNFILKKKLLINGMYKQSIVLFSFVNWFHLVFLRLNTTIIGKQGRYRGLRFIFTKKEKNQQKFQILNLNLNILSFHLPRYQKTIPPQMRKKNIPFCYFHWSEWERKTERKTKKAH